MKKEYRLIFSNNFYMDGANLQNEWYNITDVKDWPKVIERGNCNYELIEMDDKAISNTEKELRTKNDKGLMVKYDIISSLNKIEVKINEYKGLPNH